MASDAEVRGHSRHSWIHYGGHTFVNYTVPDSYGLLSWSLYEGEVGVAIPMLEVVAHLLLCMSILSVLVLIWFRKRPRKEVIIADAWAPVQPGDYAVRLYNFVGGADLLLAILTLLLMTAPIPHRGSFANWVYASARLAQPPRQPQDCFPDTPPPLPWPSPPASSVALVGVRPREGGRARVVCKC